MGTWQFAGLQINWLFLMHQVGLQVPTPLVGIITFELLAWLLLAWLQRLIVAQATWLCQVSVTEAIYVCVRSTDFQRGGVYFNHLGRH